jgi:cytoskeletal protein CcmA (bactofilin family)
MGLPSAWRSMQHVHYEFVRVGKCPELPSPGVAEEVMGFIHRVRRAERRRSATQAAAAARGSNEPAKPAAQEPLAPAQRTEPPAPARRSESLTYLGSSTTFNGELHAQGDLKIDGKVKGMIHSEEGCLSIGPEASIEADLVVRDVIIAGLVQGNVDASGKVEIRTGGTLRGDLRTQRVQMHDGAVMVGGVNMGEDLLASESAPVRKPAMAKVAPKPEASASQRERR